jgi:dGTPase
MTSGNLAEYACNPAQTRGRRYSEVPAPTRTDYQRDRDRIVHSTAFRRLVYKTQVFLNHEGDLFRTRMTHSLEVAQLGRSIARALLLNEDLVESICLAHDLGHTPFGHAGQDALNECMQTYGGFEHNLQSLRVVDCLEERYAQYDGLNLTFETREGILKHCSLQNARELEVATPGDVGLRFLNKTQPSLEAQLCNLADEVAYNAHDIDDGVRSGLISMEQLEGIPLFNQFCEEVLREYSQLRKEQGRRLLHETIRRMLSAQVYDIIDASKEALRRQAPHNADDVRKLPRMMQFSAGMREQAIVLKKFLYQNLYRHPQVMETTELAKQVVRDLFDVYMNKSDEIPRKFMDRTALYAGDAVEVNARRVADYIAGMTDRFALREHLRLTGKTVLAWT